MTQFISDEDKEHNKAVFGTVTMLILLVGAAGGFLYGMVTGLIDFRSGGPNDPNLTIGLHCERKGVVDEGNERISVWLCDGRTTYVRETGDHLPPNAEKMRLKLTIPKEEL